MIHPEQWNAEQKCGLKNNNTNYEYYDNENNKQNMMRLSQKTNFIYAMDARCEGVLLEILQGTL